MWEKQKTLLSIWKDSWNSVGILYVAEISKAERFKLISDLYDAMTDSPIKQRPGRSEPRCLKRRPKNFQLMTLPRHEMREVPHRGRCQA